MKNNKVTKWIFSLLTFLPMLAVGVMSLYTIFNKNAYQSYSDESVERISQVVLPNSLTDGITYVTTFNELESTGSTEIKVQYSDISIDWTDYGASNEYEYNRFYMQHLASGRYVIYLYYSDSSPLVSLYDVWGTTLTTFTFTKETTQTISETSCPNNFYVITYAQRTLDNAFEYSMSKFNDLGFDKVDFVGLFNDIFNSQYNVYTTFINCYLNYMLFVTLVTFVPRVLYWFINWSFGLVDKFTERGGM